MSYSGIQGQGAECLMCKESGNSRGCLECRFRSLADDIRHSLYEKMGADQNSSEWEERCLKAEDKIAALESKLKEYELADRKRVVDDIFLEAQTQIDLIELQRKCTEALAKIQEDK